MPVVSNTSPILNLAIIGKLDLLRAQCQQVLIPPAVLRELRVNEDLPGSNVVREALADGCVAHHMRIQNRRYALYRNRQ